MLGIYICVLQLRMQVPAAKAEILSQEAPASWFNKSHME